MLPQFMNACKRMKKILTPSQYNEWLVCVDRKVFNAAVRKNASDFVLLCIAFNWAGSFSGYSYWRQVANNLNKH